MADPLDEISELRGSGLLKAKELADFCSALSAYSFAKRDHPDISSLLAILRRHNVVWDSTEPIAVSEDPGFSPVLTAPETMKIVEPLLRQPFFYRMNFVKQLSTTSLWKHLEANHSRLAHSLGAAQAAEYFYLAIVRSHPNEFRDYEKRAVILYAFIHDSYHGPLGHSLELMRDQFFRGVAGRLDKHLLRGALDNPDSHLNRALGQVKHPERDKIMAFIKFLANPRKYKSKFRDRYFLLQVVDSAFDADRVDYIRRDATHLGKDLTVSGEQIQEVINAVRIIDAVDSSSDSIRSLAYPIRYKERVENYLRHRAELYAEFYEHPTKMIADDMICHALYYVLQSSGVLPLGDPEKPLFQQTVQVINELSRLTDDALFHFIFECGQPFFAQLLVRGVMTNDLFQEVCCESITFQEVKIVRSEANRLREDFEGRVATMRKERNLPPGMELSHDEFVEIFRDVLRTAKSRQAINLYFMWLLSSSGFRGRHNLERIVWTHVVRDPAVREKIRDCYFRRFGYGLSRPEVVRTLGEAPLDELLKYSHVHISVPSFVGGSERDLIQYSKEMTTEALLFCDSEGRPVPVDLEVAPTGHKAAAYVLVSAPSFLVADVAVRDAILRAFLDLLNAGHWADPKWLNQFETLG